MKSPAKKYVDKRSWRDLYILRSSKLRDHDCSEIGIKKKRVEHQESFPEICRMSHAMYTNINVLKVIHMRYIITFILVKKFGVQVPEKLRILYLGT